MSTQTPLGSAQRTLRDTSGWWLGAGVLTVLALLFALVHKPGLFVNDLIGGLIYGMILVLIALGLSLILGLMNVVNFAHGSLFMLGSYVAFQVVARSGLSFWAALVVAPLAVGAVGAVIEIGVLRRVYDEEPVVGLLATYGLVLMIDEAIRAVWGSQPHQYAVPAVLDTSTNLGVTTVSTFRVFAVVAAALTVVAVYALVTRTEFGLTVRAGVQDAEMTGFLGVDLPKRFTAMFFIGALVAGFGGVLRGAEVGLSPSLGSEFIILTFIVVVVGGIGSLFGSVVSGLLVGEAIYLTPVVCGSLADVARGVGLDGVAGVLGIGSLGHLMPYLLMVLVLLVYPRGLFGQERFLE